MGIVESRPLSFLEALGLTPKEAGNLRRSLEAGLLSSAEGIASSDQESVDILFIRPQGQRGLFQGVERMMDLILDSYLDANRFSPDAVQSRVPTVITATKRVFRSQRKLIPVVFDQNRRYDVLKESFWQGTRQNQWETFREEPTGVRYSLQLAS